MHFFAALSSICCTVDLGNEYQYDDVLLINCGSAPGDCSYGVKTEVKSINLPARISLVFLHTPSFGILLLAAVYFLLSNFTIR